MDVGGYRHNYEGFYEKTLYQISINRWRTTTTEGTHASLVGILSILLHLSWWRALKRRSNHPETVGIPLEARHLNSFKKSLKETCKYVFSFIIDDRIICSWWLGILNVRFNIFSLHLMFWSKFWKVINLRSHQCIRARLYLSRAFQRAWKRSKRMKNEGDMAISRWIIRRRRKKAFFDMGPTSPSIFLGARWGPVNPPPPVKAGPHGGSVKSGPRG